MKLSKPAILKRSVSVVVFGIESSNLNFLADARKLCDRYGRGRIMPWSLPHLPFSLRHFTWWGRGGNEGSDEPEFTYLFGRGGLCRTWKEEGKRVSQLTEWESTVDK